DGPWIHAATMLLGAHSAPMGVVLKVTSSLGSATPAEVKPPRIANASRPERMLRGMACGNSKNGSADSEHAGDPDGRSVPAGHDGDRPRGRLGAPPSPARPRQGVGAEHADRVADREGHRAGLERVTRPQE